MAYWFGKDLLDVGAEVRVQQSCNNLKKNTDSAQMVICCGDCTAGRFPIDWL